jgi:hypothetical protein
LKLLLVGSGGREHALAWKLAQSPLLSKLYAAPGNAGIAQLAELVPIAATDFAALKDFAVREKIDFAVLSKTFVRKRAFPRRRINVFTGLSPPRHTPTPSAFRW